MIISARSYPNPHALLSKDNVKLPKLEFYALGREAFLSALISMGLQKGDAVLIPAFMCNSTIKSLEAYGFDIVFIDVDQHLRLPIDQVASLISVDQVKALLIVHYFGFTQVIDEIVALCHQYDVKVIEDASHSFLSQFSVQASERRADAEIFSMRKSLPVQDGGALRLNRKNTIGCIDKPCISLISDVKNIVIRSTERVLTILGVNIYADAITKLKNNLRRFSTSGEANLECSPCLPSWSLKKYLGNELYLQKTQQIVAQNFTRLTDACTAMGFRLAFDDINHNVPQACVVYDEKGGLVEYLRARGIGAWCWPAEEMPEVVTSQVDKYPNANYFNKTLVLLPIHQSLSNQQVKHMIQVLSQWRQR